MALAHNSSDPAPTCQTMASDQINSDPAPECQIMALEYDNLSPGRKCQENVSHGDKTGTMSNELDLLFSPMFDELLNESSNVMSKSFAVSTADAPNERQQLTTPLNNHTTPAPTWIQHQTSVARTPEQNSVVERRNHTLDEAARTMLSAVKVPLFFWAEAIATTCFTQNRSLVIPRHEKTPYHIINDWKPVFNKRTRVIMESIHVNFDELPQMASAHNSSDPAPTCQTMASVQISSNPAPECQTMVLEHNSLSPGRKCQENVSHGDKTGTTSNELDLLFSPMFDELLNGSSKVVSKSSAVSAADAPNQCQQPTTPLNNHSTPVPTCQTPPNATSIISPENINQAEPHAENDQVADDEFINIFSTPVQDQGETSSRHVDSSNMHTVYQRYPSKQRWTKDHPLEQVIGNPSQSVRTRCQLESNAEMCMFALT
nr:retrovirus-related Pol polyprotein from transposon TNT 1-94 [Tanacetum cinerariifolium]